MVIVHLSANQRRIFSPQKNENLDQLFKRFCLEFGYAESEYEFRGYPDDYLETLGSNISAHLIKDVSLVLKRNSNKIKEESKNKSIHEDRPNTTDHKIRILEDPPQILEPLCSAPQTDMSIQKRLPKRSAPKPPVFSEKRAIEVADSKIPDIEIEIPPPPAFMPLDNINNNELLFKSVECETEKDSMALSDHSSNSGVRETPDSLLHESKASNSFDQSIESIDSNENVLNVEDNLDIGVGFLDITIDNRINDSQHEMDSDSNVEDVYEDENLFTNFNNNRDSVPNIKKEENNINLEELPENHEESSVINPITPDSKDSEELEDEITSEISTIEIISENAVTYQNKNDIKIDHEIPAPEAVAGVMTIQCPIAEMEDNDMSTSSSSSNEAIETQTDLVDGIDVYAKIKENQDDIEVCSEPQSIPDDLQTPKMRKIFQKYATVDVEPNDFENNQITEFQDPNQIVNSTFVDGHPVDFPLAISSEITNPKYEWELPKQSKTMQFLSRKLKTVDIIETPVSKIEGREPPTVLPKPVKQVQVTVQETPTEQSDRPTYRPRQAKSLYFTAGKN